MSLLPKRGEPRAGFGFLVEQLRCYGLYGKSRHGCLIEVYWEVYWTESLVNACSMMPSCFLSQALMRSNCASARFCVTMSANV